MQHAHGCVWIDHRQARIFGVSAESADELVIHDVDAPAHIHRRADHVHLGKAKPNTEFLDRVAGTLTGFRGFIIVGPGAARTELAGFLGDHYPALAKKVWGIEPMDHPSDAQIVAATRRYMRVSARMHD
jgi:hypothetical protein